LLLSIADSFTHSVIHPLIHSRFHSSFLEFFFYFSFLSLLLIYRVSLIFISLYIFSLHLFFFFPCPFFGELCSVNVHIGSIC
jgi:hypothetical protein